LVPPAAFDFLGFTTHWGKSLAGKWVVRQRTSKSRFRRALVAIAEWCERYRHVPVRLQEQALNKKLQGHYSYYGRIGNRGRLWQFLRQVQNTWVRWLGRRSQRRFTWKQTQAMLARNPLATPAIPIRSKPSY
jgi:RNA-directed DNA polymerase